MDSFYNASSINRDLPNIHDVKDLAKDYSNSRELFGTKIISIKEVPHFKPFAIYLNETTLFLCTLLPVLRYFAKTNLDHYKLNAGPYNFLILDIESVDLNGIAVELLLQTLPDKGKIGIYRDWRKGLLKAMLYATSKTEQRRSKDSNP